MLSSNGKLEVKVIQGFYLTVRNSDTYLHLVNKSDGEIIRYHNNNRDKNENNHNYMTACANDNHCSKITQYLVSKVTHFLFLADCIDLDLRMENGAIPDNKIAATSELSAAKNGRLNYTSGSSWCARPSDTNPYLQINLQTLYIICAVSTQGNSRTDHWVKNYTLQFSNDGTTWMVYREGGKIKVTCQRPCHFTIIDI